MAARFGHESGRLLFLDFWLTVGRSETYSERPAVRVTASYPKLARNERTINLKMELPLVLFETPSLSATITVDAPAQAVQIDAMAAVEAVRQAIGMDVDIRVVSEGTE